MKKTIIFFGATGTIGPYAIDELIKAGYRVIAFGRRKSDNGYFENQDIPYYSTDINRWDSTVPLVEDNVYAVVHLAGLVPARDNDCNPKNYTNDITGTLNVLEYAIRSKADRIIYSQSYSDISYLWGMLNPINADTDKRFPLNNDHSVYSICKNTSVDLIEHYFHKYGLKRFILRLPNIYLYHPNPYYYINGVKVWQSYRLMIEKAKRGEDIEVWGNESRQADITYVKDCCQAIVKSVIAKNTTGGIYNVGTGMGTSLEDQIKGIMEVFTEDKRSKILYAPEKRDATQFIFDIQKTKDELGYVPEYYYMDYLKDMKEEMELKRFRQLWGDDIV